ncbi:hypothetical protein B0T24DRAFT_719874 [Lasiosphaeria ovina]|uniref:AA1-like domain-containing protein n=1 Tax=Lasiosphaeria ovina TaxID=92902 RepID=A0AAE0KBL6_9PEZI|nr:hypothetical protein B0T24DRAFT_719874 [Lasiosphaeria ovina]
MHSWITYSSATTLCAFLFTICAADPGIFSEPPALVHVKQHAIIRDGIANPCENPSFQRPVYELQDFEYRKQYLVYIAGAANFTLVDRANNYSMKYGSRHLTGDIDFITADDYDFHYCDSGPILSSPDKGHLILLYRYLQGFNVLQRTYIGTAEWNFTAHLDCPNDSKERSPYGVEGPVVNCTLSKDEQTPVTRTVAWISPTPTVTEIPIRPNNASVPSMEAPPQNSNEKRCIGRSFTYPRWHVERFASDTAGGSGINLNLRHAATNYSVSCSTNTGNNGDIVCAQADGEWNKYGVLTAPDIEIHFDRSTRELSVSEAWGFLPQPLLRHQRGSHPPGPPPPAGIKTPGCSAASASPLWTVSSATQRQRRDGDITPIWNIVTRSGVVDFALLNHANDITTHCHVEAEPFTNYTNLTGDLLTFDTTKWYSCDVVDPHLFPKYNISTAMQFDKLTDFLAFNQTWYCSDEGDDHPASFTAQANTTLPLTCIDVSPPVDPLEYRFHSSAENCTAISPQALSSSSSARTALAPDELSTTELAGDSCTIDSVFATAWDVTDWTVYTVWDTWSDAWARGGDHHVEADFRLHNFGFGKTLPVLNTADQPTPYVPGSDPAMWYPCNCFPYNPDPEPLGAVYCFYRLDLATGCFAVNQSWYCDDKDADHPVLFEASGSKHLELECGFRPRDTTSPWGGGRWNNRINCNYTIPGPFKPTSITWRTLAARIS